MYDFNKKDLEQILGSDILNEQLFITAFTHRSFLNEHLDYKNPSNERLEFLGDSVLQLLSSEFLYEYFPEAPEGDLTNYRAAIVCTTSLAEESKRLGFGKFLFLSNGEETTGGREREYILANTFEAVLGALFLEKGVDFCRSFAKKELLYKIDDIVKKQAYKDAKSLFQEASQERFSLTPEYRVIESWGLDHEKTFKVGSYLENKLWGTGEGKSKQKAEQQAALESLDKLEKL